MVDTVFQCKWGVCSKNYSNVEDLFAHLTNDHIGRKSTNNLCLTCQWNNCGTAAAKRDHLASHLRVHLPLKPYKCPLCQKGFKRPQDLKKHEKIHTAEHQATLLSNQPGYKPVRRRRKTAGLASKTLDLPAISPRDLSEISSDLSSTHSPSFSLGDSMDLDDESNLIQSNYNNPLQDFIDDILLNQALPNYDADMMNKLNSITPILQQDWSLPCEPNAVPALQNWLEKLSANIQSTPEEQTTTIYPTMLTNQIPPNVLLSSSNSNSSRSPSPSLPVLPTSDYDLYPKLSWNSDADADISPLLTQKHTTSAASESSSSAVHTFPSFDDDELKPQFWSPSYIHSYTHDEILEKSPLFKQDTLSPAMAIDFSCIQPSSDKAMHFETCVTESTPIVPSLDASSTMSFVDKKEIVSLMNVFSSSDRIRYKAAREEKVVAPVELQTPPFMTSSVMELPLDDNVDIIQYPTLNNDDDDEEEEAPALHLYPVADEESEYTDDEDVKSPYADLVDLVGKLTVDEKSIQQRHTALINALLKGCIK